LFAGEQPPDFVFAGPTRTLIGRGRALSVQGSLADRELLIERAERASAEEASILVGAIPFAAPMPARLFCPKELSVGGRWWPKARPRNQEHELSVVSTPEDDAHFVSTVSRAVQLIGTGDLSKVVLARRLLLRTSGKPDVVETVRKLRLQNPHGFIFALDTSGEGEQQGTRHLVGASPELLVSRRGGRVLSAPLAGSAPRARDPAEDARRAAALKASAKDRKEHAFVVERIVETLRPFTHELRYSETPSVTATPSMWHLSTRIEGELRDRSVSSLRLALALHPTPAVCGTPTDVAYSFIRENEGFDRGYFTGTLGHMDPSGDGDWIVTIRCAELTATEIAAFSGAGIVGESDPHAELAETSAKLRTMLAALGQRLPA
jgi:isochorismate synthase